jgi:hypothetical protein
MAQLKILDTTAMRSPELDALAAEFIDDIRFASGKAMAHIADPRAFPLPADATALERILVDAAQESGEPERLAQLKAQGARFAANPVAAIDRRRTEAFTRVDLRSTTAVLDQLAASRHPPQPGTSGMHVLEGSVPGSISEPHSTLTWHLNHVTCVEETGLTAIGSDHLYIGGTTIDPFGNAVSGGVHDLTGGWDTGNTQAFDMALAVNNLSLGVGWPRTYYYVCAISVRGSDKLYEFLDKVVQYARDYAVKYASAAAGAWVGLQVGAAVGSLGGPLGAAAGAIVGAVVGYLVGAALAKLWNEISGYFKGSTKLFGSITLQVEIREQSDPYAGEVAYFPTLTWTGFGGEYQLKLDARLAWIPGFEPAAISRMPDHLDLVRTIHSTGLQTRSWPTGSGWSGWVLISTLEMSPDAPIALVAPTPSRLDLVTTDVGGKVLAMRREWTNGQPVAWTSDFLPDPPSGVIASTVVSAVSRGSGLIDVFVTAKDGKVYTAANGPQTNGKWAGWWPAGQGTFLPGTPIAAVSRSQGRIDLFAIGLDQRVWSAAYGPVSANKWDWVGWFAILDETFVPGATVSAVSRKADQLDVFAVNLNGEVRTAAWAPGANNGKWGGWWRITEANGKFAPGTPIAVVHRSPDHLDVFAIGLDGCVWSAAWGPQTSHKWAGWWRIGQATFAQGSRIAATARSLNRIDLFVRGFDGNVWSQAWDGAWKEFVI